MDSRSDEQLLADHLAGVPGAFEHLVDRYTHDLYVFLCRFAGNSSVAEDLIQDAFVQVHLRAASFDPERRFKPWLYTIAANKARDYLRSRGRKPEFSLDVNLSGDGEGPTAAQNLEGGEPDQSESVERDEQRAAVRAVIDQMPEHLRMILMLGYFQQLPYAEIAEILEIPVGTVKSRLHAAVNRFAQMWEQQSPADSAAPDKG